LTDTFAGSAKVNFAQQFPGSGTSRSKGAHDEHQESQMSRRHVMVIAEASARAFLFGDEDRTVAGAQMLRVNSKRVGGRQQRVLDRRSRRTPAGRTAGP
jgi:hypothetical protein